jgi:transposase-like protein
MHPGRAAQEENEPMAQQIPDNVQRWTAKRRAALILSILKGETSEHDAAGRHGLSVSELRTWRERFLVGAENALRERPKDEEALKDARIRTLERKIGELVVDMDLLRDSMKSHRGLSEDRHADE